MSYRRESRSTLSLCDPDFVERLPELGLVNEVVMRQRMPCGIHQEVGWSAFNPVPLRRRNGLMSSRIVGNHGKCDAILAGKGPDFRRGVGPYVDGDNSEPAVFEIVINALKVRQLLTTAASVDLPEVD